MKAFRRLLLILFFLFLTLVGIGIVLFQINQKTIKQQLLAELNEQLTTLVDVEDITFNFLRHFPNITANFKQATIYSPKDFSSKYSNEVSVDTLLNVNNIYLELNSFGLIRKKIIFNKILLNNGWLNIIVNEKGLNNYQVFKSKKEKDSEEYSLNLRTVEFKNIYFKYHDLAKNLIVNTSIDEFKSGRKNNNSSIKIQSKITIRELKSKETLILYNKTLTSNIAMSVNDDVFAISNGSLDYAGIRANISGTIEKKEELFIDWVVNSSDNKIKSLIQLIPESIQKTFKSLKVEGNLTVRGSIKGVLGNNKYPHINFQFDINKGLFFDSKSKLKFSNITASGNWDNGTQNRATTTMIRLNNFKAEIGGETISGSYTLQNLENPFIKLTTSGIFNLKEFVKLTPNTDAEILDGLARVNISVTGKLKEFRKISLNDLEKFNPVGQVELVDVNYKTFKRPILYSSVSGKISLGDRFLLDSLYLEINDNPIILNGEAKNVLSYLNEKRKPLIITGMAESPHFDLSNIIPGKEKKVTMQPVILPENIEAYIKLDADRFSYNKFETENFSCSILYTPASLILDRVGFSSMNGETSGDITIFEQSDSVLQMHIRAHVHNIDIQKLFYQMNDFGQTFIKAENLEGNVSGDIKFYSKWSNELRIDKKSVIAESNYTIENGKLVDFEPIQKLSRFIAIEELKNIEFSKLENDVYINNEIINIPLMEIKSSAFNIEASGTHYFNKNYSYNVNVLLSDILASKAKKKKKENSEFGIIEDDGLGKTMIPLKIIGDGKDTKVSYDRKGMTRNIKINLQKEKQNLKQIFSNEFGKQKSDTTSLSEKKETKKFNITWEEEEVPDSTIKK